MNRILKIVLFFIPAIIILTIGGYFLTKNSNMFYDGVIVKNEFTDEEILDAVTKGVRYPKGFYQEDLQGGLIHYETVLSADKKSRIQVCRDDKDQAKGVSESGSKSMSYYRELVSQRETEKYFEFRRVYSKRPSDILLSRVHKCSYLDPKYSKNDDKMIIGIFKQRPITIKNVQELAQYIHFVNQFYGVSSDIILGSFPVEQERSIEYVIYSTSSAGNFQGTCTRYNLTKYTYAVDKISGEISLVSESIKYVPGRCDSKEVKPGVSVPF